MILVINDLLDAKMAAAAAEAAASAPFVDGRRTAGWHAREVKNNLQVDAEDAAFSDLRRQIAQAVLRHPLFVRAFLPKAMAAVMINRYDPGMTYGTHVDDPLMAGMRTDVSFTVFLSDPKSYAGGELVIDTSSGRQAYKLPVGAGVAYPSGALHRVQPVTGGTRLAAVGWTQSLVRDPARRELLFDLDQASRAIFEQHGKTPAFDAVAKSLANLQRMWIET